MIKKFKGGAAIFLSVAAFVACNDAGSGSEEKYVRELSDSIKADAIRANFEDKDSAIVNAYVFDSSTITINDIDPNDKSYTTRSKTLYKPGPDGKALAVVYGYKTEGKGIAVMQKIGEKPVVLKEKDMEGDVRVYSNGKITLQKSGTFAFVDGAQYEEVK